MPRSAARGARDTLARLETLALSCSKDFLALRQSWREPRAIQHAWLASGLPLSAVHMTFLTDGRLLAFVTTAATTVYDVVSVATCSLLLWLAARGSRGNHTRDLFGVLLAVSALAGS